MLSGLSSQGVDQGQGMIDIATEATQFRLNILSKLMSLFHMYRNLQILIMVLIPSACTHCQT